MRIVGWRPLIKGTLRGFLDLEVMVENNHPLTIFECPVHLGENGPWVGFPAKAQVDRDGKLRRKSNGKPDYTAVMKWGDAATREAFSRAAIQLLLKRYPDALHRGRGRVAMTPRCRGPPTGVVAIPKKNGSLFRGSRHGDHLSRGGRNRRRPRLRPSRQQGRISLRLPAVRQA
jgi:hypothetical protein